MQGKRTSIFSQKQKAPRANAQAAPQTQKPQQTESRTGPGVAAAKEDASEVPNTQKAGELTQDATAAPAVATRASACDSSYPM
jgi:hypothetical protein